MVIDYLDNAAYYIALHSGIARALQYLQSTDFTSIEKGKYEIEGDNLFAVVNEYETIPAEDAQMEAHKKYIDVQFIVTGEEQIGHSYLINQVPSKAYNEEKDFMLFSEVPSFYTKLKKGMFAVFFPTDLHAPNLQISSPIQVKKVVVKVKV